MKSVKRIRVLRRLHFFSKELDLVGPELDIFDVRKTPMIFFNHEMFEIFYNLI